MQVVVREHDAVVTQWVLGEVPGQRVYDHARQRQGPVGRIGLGWRERRSAAGHEHELTVDGERAPQEIDAVNGHAECLTLSDAGARAQHDELRVSAFPVRKTSRRLHATPEQPLGDDREDYAF